MNDIDSRLRQLEHSLARWRAAVIILTIVTAVFLVQTSFRAQRVIVPPAAPPRFEQLSVGHLQVQSLTVLDAKGTAVISMMEGAGGGLLSINSGTPNDHNVMLLANPYGATVQVSSQVEPRQFGYLKIMDRKPYLQLTGDGKAGGVGTIYQVPSYTSDGKIGPNPPSPTD